MIINTQIKLNYVRFMKLYYYFLVTILIVETVTSSKWCTWTFQSINMSNPWAQFGLQSTINKCLWDNQQSKPQITISLYKKLLIDFVPIQIYFDDSYDAGYLYYNSTAQITFPQCKEETCNDASSKCILQSRVLLNNSKLIVTLQNGKTLTIQLSSNEIQYESFLLQKHTQFLVCNIAFVMTSLFLDIHQKRLAIELAVANLGWVGFLILQFGRFLFYFKDEPSNIVNTLILYISIDIILFLMVLYGYENKSERPKFKIYFVWILVCENIIALTLSKSISFILFTLNLSIQIVYNTRNKQKCTVPFFFIGIYLFHIFLILCTIGFIPNKRCFEADYYVGVSIIILAGLQVIILVMQQIIGPYLGLKQMKILPNQLEGKELVEQLEMNNQENEQILMNKKAIADMKAAGII